MINYDINQIPFSRYGSYISFSFIDERWDAKQDFARGLYLRNIHGDSPSKEVFRIEASFQGNSLPFSVSYIPEMMTLHSEYGKAYFCISEPKKLLIRSHGISLKFFSEGYWIHDNIIQRGNNTWVLNCKKNRISYLLHIFSGKLVLNSPWDGIKCSRMDFELIPDQDSKIFEGVILEFRCSPNVNGLCYEPFFEAVNKVKVEFESFLSKMPEVHQSYSKTREIASYVNWSSVITPEGHLKYPAMLMSKNWMTNIYSWDHCFNALALSYGLPDLAWQQFSIFFEMQDETGALPDFCNDCLKIWNFTKPPIHGWTFNKMLNNSDYFKDIKLLRYAYDKLCLWTKWWLNYRDDDKDGIPEYNHGNDSGWDNSTVFSVSPMVESPDLTAFLILQTDLLSEIAGMLYLKEEKEYWYKLCKNLERNFFKHFLFDNKLMAFIPFTHEHVKNKSLLMYMPLILGRRLPQELVSSMILDLKNKEKFLTDFGLATESLSSEYYEDDGYWRGPIWAPSTLLIIEGLKQAGEYDFAKILIKKYCDMVMTEGFSENFSAKTGQGYRDPAYTWTSSVFLILAHELLYL